MNVPLHIPAASKAMITEAKKGAGIGDTIFLNKLSEGYRWQVFVLSALQAYGFWGCVHPLRVRPDASKAADFSDGYDIKLGNGPGETEAWEEVVDVKARTRSFEDPDSFPFDTIIIEPNARFERRDDYPDTWCMVSQYTGGMIFIPNYGMDDWAVEFKNGIAYKTAPREEFLSLEQYVGILPEPEVGLEC